MKDLLASILDFQTNNFPEDLITHLIFRGEMKWVWLIYFNFCEMPNMEQKALQ
jgi:hypothetical protein